MIFAHWSAGRGVPRAHGVASDVPGVSASWATRVAPVVIEAYRLLLSPLVGGACRYTPSCSAYAEEAFRRHRGSQAAWLTLKRLARCRPFGGFGYDPVPPAEAGDDHSTVDTAVSRVKG